MASHTESSGIDGFLRWLATYRLVIYFGGVLAIATPRLLRIATDLEVGPVVRTVLVVTSLGVMILTYLGERRMRTGTSGHRDDRTGGRTRRERATTDTESGRGSGPETDAGARSRAESNAATSDSADDTPQYSRRTRAAFAAGVVGVVFGIYVALETSVPAGLLFVFGAILFVQSAYRRERGAEGE